MPIYLPETTASTSESLTPREIVAELDKYVIGQAQAKRAVAIALRNRTRRQKLPPEIAEEIAPKNILMIGPTGVGKTEIARRLARLAQSPFIKVEASKFTEVGYVGRDVESMVRDLVELAVDMVKEERLVEVREKAREAAEERVLDLLLPPLPPAPDYDDQACGTPRAGAAHAREAARAAARRRGSITSRWRSTSGRRAFPSFEIIARLLGRRSRHQRQGHAARAVPGQDAQTTPAHPGGARRARAGRGTEAHRHGEHRARGGRPRAGGRDHLHRRNRQGGRPRRWPRAGRQPRGRAARHPADRRGHDGEHQVRDGAEPITSCSSRPARSTCRSRPI